MESYDPNSFDALKKAFLNTPILQLPEFKKPFLHK